MQSLSVRRVLLVGALVFALLACAGFVIGGINYQRTVAVGLSTSLASFDLHRARIWWLSGAVGSAACILVGSLVVAARRSAARPLTRAVWDLFLIAVLVIAGPVTVSAGIALTRANQPFLDCVFPGPLLLWSPSLVAALGVFIAAFRREPRAA